MGQSVEEAEIVQWIKAEGDTVEVGQPLFTVQTDKAEIEYESPESGVLHKILVPEGVEVPVFTVVALIGAPGEALPDLAQYTPRRSANTAPTATAPPATPATAQPHATALPAQSTTESRFASPRARRIAADHHINTAALAGTGPQGRVLAEDVEKYRATLDSVRISPTARRIAASQGLDPRGIAGSGAQGRIMKNDLPTAQPRFSLAPMELPANPGATRVPLSPMRRTIARRMAESKFTAPHYYVTVEIDMTAAKRFRAASTEFKPSFNDFVLYAAARALVEFPKVNTRWLGDALEVGGDVNLGMAVALPEGLIVPVIRKAHTLGLRELSTQARVLAEKAQQNKLTPDEYAGNTFTVSNLGAFGVDHFTAIINQPDSAILAVGQMKDRPVVVEGEILIRPIMKATLSSDHRVIDGALAAQFMGRLRALLETGAFEA
jgi:pyruvate dehydrogenase E2 component (dihydrolipoamide acetyltransferase)